MADTIVESLILDLLEWLAVADRTSPTGGQHAILSPCPSRIFYRTAKQYLIRLSQLRGPTSSALHEFRSCAAECAVRFEPVCANMGFFATSTRVLPCGLGCGQVIDFRW